MKDVFPESLGQKHGCAYTQVGSFVSKLACKPFKAETHHYHTTHITWQKVSYKRSILTYSCSTFIPCCPRQARNLNVLVAFKDIAHSYYLKNK